MIDHNEKTKKFYRNQFWHCQEAMDYFLPRVLDPLVAGEFDIGLAGSYNELTAHVMKNDRYHLNQYKDDGLIRTGETNNYDAFKERIMFPIKDHRGKVVGFSGRTFIKGDDRPKYVNSDGSKTFQKSKILFNLDKAKPFIQKKGFVFIVEGYLDVMALHAHFYKNVVATMGTALTVDHVKLLKKYTKRAIVVYDGDKAGQEATKQAINMLMNEKIDVKTVVMPEGQDPADYADEHGHLDILDKPRSHYYATYEAALKEILDSGWTDVRKLSACINEIPKHLYNAPFPVYYKLFKHMAVALNISFSSIAEDILATHEHFDELEDVKWLEQS